jgi:hypothetical protein
MSIEKEKTAHVRVSLSCKQLLKKYSESSGISMTYIINNLIIDNFKKIKKSVKRKTKEICISEKSESASTNKLMALFKTINPALNFGNKTERSAIEWLVAEKGEPQSIKIIEFVIKVSGMDYAPVITTPYELKMKYAKLEAYAKRQLNKPSNVLKI